MLVLSRKKNESIVIDNAITVTVVEIRGDKVRLGIVAPKEVPVHRQEVFDAIHGTKAEAELLAREKRVQRFKLVSLTAEDASRFAQAWGVLQTRFVDNPRGVVVEADRLVRDLMVKRGYPMADFERRFLENFSLNDRALRQLRLSDVDRLQRHAANRAGSGVLAWRQRDKAAGHPEGVRPGAATREVPSLMPA